MAVLGVVYTTVSSASAPTVGVGDTIEVNYTGTFTNGTVFGSNAGQQPLKFTVGAGQVIPGFDNGVIGMKLGEEKTVTVPAGEAYGQVNSSLIVQVPISSFGNKTVQAGMTVGESINGRLIQGIITAVNATKATVNFNPPLAGKTLIFKIQVIGIQKKS
ncbi:MAG: FKBP-type peptidyl-prolyl cis-trans isomerase [Candidatus Micrarchaeaceae archaeon]